MEFPFCSIGSSQLTRVLVGCTLGMFCFTISHGNFHRARPGPIALVNFNCTRRKDE